MKTFSPLSAEALCEGGCGRGSLRQRVGAKRRPMINTAKRRAGIHTSPALFSAFVRRPALFSLDARELDHLRPLFDGIREDRSEFRRRAAKHGAAQLDDPGFDFAI